MRNSYENADRPNVFWIEINKLDLKAGAPIKKLSLQYGEVYAGEVRSTLLRANPFLDRIKCNMVIKGSEIHKVTNKSQKDEKSV